MVWTRSFKTADRKCQDYVYVESEYLKYYVENKALFETWKSVLAYFDLSW